MSEGYYAVMLPLDSPYLPMAWAKGYVLEHRLVMAQYLGRCLTAGESVHHINGIRDDNRIENLVIFERSSHLREHISRGYRDGFKLGYKEGFERGTRQANSVA